MQRFLLVLAAVAVLLVLSRYAESQQTPPQGAPQPAAPAAPTGLFDGIQPGQVVGLERTGDSYRVTVNPRWRIRDVYTVLSVSKEGLVVETQNRELELRIPTFSILEVAVSKTGVR